MQRALVISLATLLASTAISAAQAPAPPAPRPYYVGNEGLGLPVAPPAPGAPAAPFAPASDNVKMYGALYSVESCSYDPVRNLIVAPNRGVGQNVRANDAWISFINHDGSVHTPRWIGIQNPGEQRDTMTPPLVLNEPLGSIIVDGTLYLADRDGGTMDMNANPPAPTPSVAVIRMFDMATGAPKGEVKVPGSTGLNDLAVAADGTIYGTNTGAGGQNPDTSTWAIWKAAPDGTVSQFFSGPPLNRPNGIEVDKDGNIVVVNIGTADVITFSPAGQVLKTEQAAQSGNDGLVLMPDGTKYVSSVLNGGVSKILPGQPATLIAENIPSAASMCYDPEANQLVIPMNANNGLAFIKLQ